MVGGFCIFGICICESVVEMVMVCMGMVLDDINVFVYVFVLM